MKAHKIEILIIDFDEMGADEIKSTIENTSYPNRCMYPDVMNIETVDLGEWNDEHPLNLKDTFEQEYQRLFNNQNKG